MAACVGVGPDGVRVTLGLGWLVVDCVGVGKEVAVGKTALGDNPTQAVRASIKTPTAVPKRSASSLRLRW